MEKSVTRRFRLSEEQDRELREQAASLRLGVSEYIRRELGLEGLSDRPVVVARIQRPRGESPRVPGSQAVPQDKTLTRLIKQLEAQGKPHPEAEARRRLGL